MQSYDLGAEDSSVILNNMGKADVSPLSAGILT